MEVERAEFMADGKCRDVPAETFFPSDGLGVIAAQKICATCAVRAECLEYALANHVDYGVWGGESERARRRIRRERRLAARASSAPAPAPAKKAGRRRARASREPTHGTPAGWAWHRREGVPACEPCAAAMRERRGVYNRRYYEGQRARRKAASAASPVLELVPRGPVTSAAEPLADVG